MFLIWSSNNKDCILNLFIENNPNNYVCKWEDAWKILQSVIEAKIGLAKILSHLGTAQVTLAMLLLYLHKVFKVLEELVLVKAMSISNSLFLRNELLQTCITDHTVPWNIRTADYWKNTKLASTSS